MADTTTANYGWAKPTVGADADNWGGTLNSDLDAIDATVRATVPAGAIVLWGGSTAAPSGYLLCNGAAVSRTTYAGLFNAIGTIHGVGDGSTSFNLPNLEDCFVVGAGASYGVAAQGGAAAQTTTVTVEAHVLTTTEMPSHSHGVTDPGHGHGVSDPGHSHGVNDPGHDHGLPSFVQQAGAGNNLGGGGGQFETVTGQITNGAATGIGLDGAVTGIAIGGSGTGVSLQSNGGDGGHSHAASATNTTNLPPYYALCYIVKT